MNILIVGDSHAKARLPSGEDSDIIARELEVPDVYRLARSGSTARQWLDPSNGWLAMAEALAAECDAVFLSIGGNDLFRDYADGHLSREEAERIMGEVKAVADRFGGKRLFLLVYGDPYNGRDNMTLAGVICITIAFRILAATLPNVTLVLEQKLLDASDWCGSDIHPNASGYVKIADFIRKEMTQ